jgi:hypothetical protein
MYKGPQKIKDDKDVEITAIMDISLGMSIKAPWWRELQTSAPPGSVPVIRSLLHGTYAHTN